MMSSFKGGPLLPLRRTATEASFSLPGPNNATTEGESPFMSSSKQACMFHLGPSPQQLSQPVSMHRHKGGKTLCRHTTDNRHIPASVKESYLRIFISGHIPGTTCVVAGVGGHENRNPEKLYSGDLGSHFQCLFKFY